MKKKTGFTLVEIMIVVAIIGLLATLGIPAFSKARAQTLRKNMENNARMLSRSIARFALDKGLQDDAVIEKEKIKTYIKGGWDGLAIRSTPAIFPENKTVIYWESDLNTIAKNLYPTLYD